MGILRWYLGQLWSADTEEGKKEESDETTMENSGLIIGKKGKQREKISFFLYIYIWENIFFFYIYISICRQLNKFTTVIKFKKVTLKAQP